MTGSAIPFGGISPDIHESCFIADNARIIGDAVIGAGTSVWYGTVIRADSCYVRIGENCSIQDNCVIHIGSSMEAGSDEGTPAIVGDYVTVGHGAIIHACTVEDGCIIGMGAVVLDGAVIGRGSTVGAGALVTKNTVIPPNSVAVGSPAKVIKTLGEESFEANVEHAKHYVELAGEYM